MRSIEPGISRFRVWSFGPSRNDAIVGKLRARPLGDGWKAARALEGGGWGAPPPFIRRHWGDV
ncbi:hypothetical protein FDV58_30955 [Bradyrhizobium elkanii]|uniref:Uncharacterized protein n=1 Tax=Bradyrhizobium elkanii TaxID=29448 RepID=A0A4U6RRX1_BRAEL|nr:hypothetical protein [Bradyrhizobium sp. BR2003]TKV77474.1 hypothetical protein FDV58_30955 [Bradyrhizobium elkanii]